ncbi:MAG: helix-turn-helix domain-containing protein [Pseudomonadota bacterium]
MENILKKQLVEDIPKTNRMDKRRLATRSKLLTATLDLVVEKGIDKTTMDDITEKADLGRRTLYYHFDSKEECVVASAAEFYTHIAAQADESAHQHQDPALAFAIAGQLVIRQLINAPVTKKLIAHPHLLAAAIKASVSSYAHQDMMLGMEQERFSMALHGPLLDTTVLWALVGILIDTIDSDLVVDESLAYFTQIHLVFLGLPRDEAQSIALEAAGITRQ